MTIRTYSELIRLHTHEERFKYLQLKGKVGAETFGFNRHLNQQFYKSKEWDTVRQEVIIRDNGCDLGIEGFEIHGPIYVHHINALDLTDINMSTENLLNPEYLISTSFSTHNDIHYGVGKYKNQQPIERTPYDTCPWKK